jgi:hypothetical protein
MHRLSYSGSVGNKSRLVGLITYGTFTGPRNEKDPTSIQLMSKRPISCQVHAMRHKHSKPDVMHTTQLDDTDDGTERSPRHMYRGRTRNALKTLGVRVTDVNMPNVTPTDPTDQHI